MKKLGRTRQEKIILWVVFPVLFLWSLTLIYPFVWAFLNSFKTIDGYQISSFAFPDTWRFSNWARAFKELQLRRSDGTYVHLWGMIFNSLWYTLGGALLSTVSAAMLAYAVAKYRFRFCKFLYSLSVVVMMLPVVSSMATEYKYFHLWGITNSPVYLVTALGSIGTSTFLILYAAFKSIPWTYAESVFVDGGGNWTVFLRIMLPQAMPMLTAMFILGCVGRWNDYMSPYLYLGDLPTLAVALYYLENAGKTKYDKPLFFSSVLISVIPIFVVFVAFSNKIMNNVSLGGLKG